MKKLIFLDTETTGLRDTDRIFQLAHTRPLDADIAGLYNGLLLLDFPTVYSHFYAIPEGVEMEVAVMATTQTTPEMLADHNNGTIAKEMEELKKPGNMELSQNSDAVLACAGQPETYFVAHNADFDRSMLEREGIKHPKWLCTKKIVAHYLDLTSYKLQELRYILDEEHIFYRRRFDAHEAAEDVRALFMVFGFAYAYIVRHYCEPHKLTPPSIEELAEISERPMKIRRFAFGKHKGALLTDTYRDHSDYFDWLLRQKDIDEDLRYNLREAMREVREDVRAKNASRSVGTELEALSKPTAFVKSLGI